ncbi:MAG: hypothetical protein IPN57_08075 [Ignavibacteria bacterium]|nr:hypothetical protein [Ignavibacteria bacterium]
MKEYNILSELHTSTQFNYKSFTNTQRISICWKCFGNVAGVVNKGDNS